MLYTIQNPIRCFHKKEGKLQIVFSIYLFLYWLVLLFVKFTYGFFKQTMPQSVDVGAAVPNPRVSFIAKAIVCNGIIHASESSHLIFSVPQFCLFPSPANGKIHLRYKRNRKTRKLRGS